MAAQQQLFRSFSHNTQVLMLLEMGFDLDEAARALADAMGDIDLALDHLATAQRAQAEQAAAEAAAAAAQSEAAAAAAAAANDPGRVFATALRRQASLQRQATLPSAPPAPEPTGRVTPPDVCECLVCYDHVRRDDLGDAAFWGRHTAFCGHMFHRECWAVRSTMSKTRRRWRRKKEANEMGGD